MDRTIPWKTDEEGIWVQIEKVVWGRGVSRPG